MANLRQNRQEMGEGENLRIPPSPPPACGAHCTESPFPAESASADRENPSLLSPLSPPSRDISGTWGFLSLSAWARAHRRSFERARKLCHLGEVEGAIPFRTARRQTSYIIPADAPWPARDVAAPGRPLPPPGYILLPDWARACGRSPNTARIHLRLRHIPEAIHFGPSEYHVAVPADLPWPAKPTGRPRIHPIPQGEPSGCSQGAGESRGGRPTPSSQPAPAVSGIPKG